MNDKPIVIQKTSRFKIYLSGLLSTLLLALLAFWLSGFLPVGAVVIGISLGIIFSNVIGVKETWLPGIQFAEKQILAWAIILMGVKLDFNIVKELGLKAILIIIAAIIFTISISQILGRLLHMNRRLALLLGIGNGVCGSSAIAATEKIIGADKHEVGISVTVVNFLGVIGMFLLPLFAKFMLAFNDLQSGFLIGNTLQAVGQVVAAGFSINETVGHTATIVKMMRILMLTPIVLTLLLYFHQKGKKQVVVDKKQGLPYFIIGFILMSLMPSFHLLNPDIITILGKLSHYLLLIAMVAIGLKISFKHIVKQGGKALLAGSMIFLFQILFSVLMIVLLIRK